MPTAITDADLYRRSSQYRLWSFTRAELAEKCVQANRRVPPSAHTLTAEEEQQLVTFFAAVQIKSLCQAFGLPSQVRATAVSFFRKFYLSYSVMEYEPKLVLCTCVFLAAKSDNCYIPIQRFCESLENIEPQQILDLEFELFSTLQFTVQVHSALSPLHGFFLDMQSVLDSSIEEIAAIHNKARAMVLDTLVTDASFLYTPTQIALAALMEANELVTTEYMAHSMDGPNTSLQRLLNIVGECRAVLRTALPPKDVCKAISKRLNQYYKLQGEEGPQRKKARASA